MKRKILKIFKKEGGQALILVLAILGVGSIILAPMLDFMGSGLKVGSAYESKERVIYAADAGVEDAVWKIQNGGEGLVDTTTVEEELGITGVVIQDTLPPYLFPITDPESPYYPYYTFDSLTYDIADVNGNSVGITIEFNSGRDGIAYKVTSNAPADGSGTEIEAWVTTVYGDYGGITENVITSPNGWDYTGGQTIIDPPDGEHGPDGEYDGPWPTAFELINYYSMFVNKTNPYDYDELDLNDDATFDYDFIIDNGNEIQIGTAYIDGDFLFHSSKNDMVLTLTGNLYITGNVEFGGEKEWTLDLNGYSIFVESNAVGGGASGTALWVGSKVTLTGWGCMVAIGDINFEPHMDADPYDYILILSAIGQTWMHPNGDFYGTLAGRSEVYVQNGQAHWSDPDPDGDGLPNIDFPGGSSATMEYGVLSWKIS